MQEAAIAAFRRWGELRAHVAVKSWLLRILRWTYLNAARHASRRPPFVDTDIDELIGYPILVDVEELTIAETAEVLELPVGTVASRVHRARRLLLEALGAGRQRKDV